MLAEFITFIWPSNDAQEYEKYEFQLLAYKGKIIIAETSS